MLRIPRFFCAAYAVESPLAPSWELSLSILTYVFRTRICSVLQQYALLGLFLGRVFERLLTV